MSDLVLKPLSPPKQPTTAPIGSNASVRPEEPPPFTRSQPVDGGRFSNTGHRLATFTREIFGRNHPQATPMNVAATALAEMPPASAVAPRREPPTPQQAERSAIGAFRPLPGETFRSPANRAELLTWL